MNYKRLTRINVELDEISQHLKGLHYVSWHSTNATETWVNRMRINLEVRERELVTKKEQLLSKKWYQFWK